MKIKVVVKVFLSVILIVSCNNDKESKVTEEIKQPVQPFSGEVWLKQRIGEQNQQSVQQKSIQQQTTTPVQANGGLNPPHGQPGHRCDIPVGAPLDTKPVQKNKTQNAQIATTKSAVQPVVKMITNEGSTKVTNASSLPGMNPPHGQEGHRCDIAVGAPLPKE